MVGTKKLSFYCMLNKGHMVNSTQLSLYCMLNKVHVAVIHWTTQSCPFSFTACSTKYTVQSYSEQHRAVLLVLLHVQQSTLYSHTVNNTHTVLFVFLCAQQSTLYSYTVSVSNTQLSFYCVLNQVHCTVNNAQMSSYSLCTPQNTLWQWLWVSNAQLIQQSIP